jgi:catechol 2,3-dioxygenase-like lactoylglutathione lyase family enzyme
MKITYLELPTKDLQAQEDYYSNVLGLLVNLSAEKLEVKVGDTELVFTQADSDFYGAYHFAFNIPENQFRASKEWIASRVPLLRDTEGRDEFASQSWKSHSIYFKDAAGNVLEFIARHNLKNAVDGDFDGGKILNVSEIGLPSENVVPLANELCTKLNLSVFHQEPSETFTPVGDDNGLFVLPIIDRIWIPNSGVPAKLLPVKVGVDVNDKKWEVRGFPYEFIYSSPSTL